jgi:hypothetical protein
MENPIQFKKCSHCLIEKSISEFNKHRRNRDGLCYLCKDCRKIEKRKYKETDRKRKRQWRLENIDRVKAKKREYEAKNREGINRQMKEWRNKNPEKCIQYSQKYYEKNKEIILQKGRIRGKNYRSQPENKEKMNVYIKNRYKNNIKFNINMRMGSNIRHSLRGSKKGRKWETLVGYTKDDLKNHLESKFTEGMSWEKFLNGEIEIDHIICKELFEYETAEDPQFKACWELRNLGPIWFIENCRKNDSLSDGRRARDLTKEEKLEYLKSLGYNF